jgi:ABC-2 type transport system permease protein
MDKFWVVAKREYLERVRSRWFIIMTLLIPALIAASFLFPLYLASRSAAQAGLRNLVILDATGAGLGKRVSEVLLADSVAARAGTLSPPRVRELTMQELPAAEQEATRDVMRPKATGGFLVLDDSTLGGARARYAGRNASSIAEIDKLRSAVRQGIMMVRLEREGVRPATISEISKISLRMSAERIDERGRGGSGQAGFILGIGIGILLLMSIVFHGQFVLRGVLEEKTSRVAEVVISSVKPSTLLAGKVAGAGAVGLTQQILWLAVSAYLIQSVAPILLKSSPGLAAGASGAASVGFTFGGLSIGLFVTVILYFVLGFIFYASLLAAAGSMVNSEQDAQQAAMPVMFLLMGTWIFVNPVLLSPNGTIATVLSWLPFSSPIIMPMRMGLASVPWTSVAGSLAVCALGCVGAVWLASRIYRVGMLMYGKRPSMGEVVKWLRYA